MVALLFMSSKVPLTVNFDPAKVAVAEPVPAILPFIDASMATGARRVLNVSGLCAPALSANKLPMARANMDFRMDLLSDLLKNIIRQAVDRGILAFEEGNRVRFPQWMAQLRLALQLHVHAVGVFELPAVFAFGLRVRTVAL